MYAVQTADDDILSLLSDEAASGRAQAQAHRRAMAAGRIGLTSARPTSDRASRTEPPRVEPAEAPPVPTHEPPAASAVGAVGDAHLGRELSMRRRRQLSRGKGVAQASAPSAASPASGARPGDAGSVSDAHLGRVLSMQRRRALSRGKQHLSPGSWSGPAVARQVAADGLPQATMQPGSDSVRDAQLGREMSKARRRDLSRGRGAGADQEKAPAAGGSDGPAASQPGPAPSGDADRGSVADARLGRALSMKRRRQLSWGKVGLGDGGLATTPDGPGDDETAVVIRPGDGADALGFPSKVTASPTYGGMAVTGGRIAAGALVTGAEAGGALPVSGSQYVPADLAPTTAAPGPKVGLARTAGGQTVSGTMVRSAVTITGDEAGEHLAVTGEADQKLIDDMTPRPTTIHRSAQFPRRADPHGATAVGTRLGGVVGPSTPALETSIGGLAVTGTAVGRSARVTGDEAGAGRLLTGDQYQTSAEGAVVRGRIDPVTGAKVSQSTTWRGQRVTGPAFEHRGNVTGDEPGLRGALTGTPYLGPSNDSHAGGSTAEVSRLEPRTGGVAVSGDVPEHTESVTGTARGQGHSITGSAYHDTMRPSEPVPGAWSGGSPFPGALARRGRPPEDEAVESSERVTGSFAVAQGMVTGNNEFLFRARVDRSDVKAASVVTGEGSSTGPTVTGSAWTAHDRVTGTEGYIASGRNPSERSGRPHGWAGAGKFRDRGTPGDSRLLVTGQSGATETRGASVTLSGGARA